MSSANCLTDSANKMKESLKQVASLLEELTEARQDYAAVDDQLKRLILLQSDLEVLRSRYRLVMRDACTENLTEFVTIDDWSIVSAFLDIKKQQWRVHHDGPMPRLDRQGNLICKNATVDPMLAVDTDDIELSVSEVKQSDRCPLTQSKLEKPVRSTLCGHLFSRDAIEAYLRLNVGDSICPVAGCSKRLKMSALESVAKPKEDEAKELNERDFKLFE